MASDKLKMENIDQSLEHLRQLSNVLEDRLQKRAEQLELQRPAFMLPNAKSPLDDEIAKSLHADLVQSVMPPPGSAIERQPGFVPHTFSREGRSRPATRDAQGGLLPLDSRLLRSTSPSRGGGRGGASPERSTSRGTLAGRPGTHEAAGANKTMHHSIDSSMSAMFQSPEARLLIATPQSQGGVGRETSNPSRRTALAWGPQAPTHTQQAPAAPMMAFKPVVRVSVAPGTLKFKTMLMGLEDPRFDEMSEFRRDMENMDQDIDEFLATCKLQRNLPDAALALQTAWRARGPRLMLKNFIIQKHRSNRYALYSTMIPWLVLVRAVKYARVRLMRMCFQEWRELGLLKMQLYSKAIVKLRASMLDVRESQSPQHLLLLCMAEGEKPWKAKLSLGRLVSNIIIRQYPARMLKLYFNVWRKSVYGVDSQRSKAAQTIENMIDGRVKKQLLEVFRFWYRYAVTKVSERLEIDIPLFRPRMPIWDSWLTEHIRSQELKSRIPLLHMGTRMGFCFRFWRTFTVRNIKMRSAWISVAATQIEDILQWSMGGIKANWQYNKYRRRMVSTVLSAWMWITARNIEVRNISKSVAFNTRKSILALSFRRLRIWANMNGMLSLASSVQIWQRRALCMIPMYAMVGDTIHMWFVLAWYRWRNMAVGRLRFKAFLGAHCARRKVSFQELCFKGWRKLVEERRDIMVELAHAMAERRSDRVERHALRGLPAYGANPFMGISLELSESVSIAAKVSVSVLDVSDDEMLSPPGSSAGGQTRRSHGDLSARSSNAALAHQGDLTNRSSVSIASAFGSAQKIFKTTHARHHHFLDQDVNNAEDLLGPEVVARLKDDMGNVFVSLADFPFASAWRPIVDRRKILKTNNTATVGIAEPRIDKSLQHLKGLEGQFYPDHMKTQLALDVCSHMDMSTWQRQWIDKDHPIVQIWLNNQEPDISLWQRVVGLMATRLEPHPDHWGPLIEQDKLPFLKEVVPIKRGQYITRNRMKTTEGTHVNKTRHMMATTSKLFAGLEEELGLNAKDKDLKWLYLTEDQRDTMFAYKLAEAEQFLETCVAQLIGVGSKDFTAMYKVARQRCPPAMKFEGDMLTWILKPASQHDRVFMAANMQYRINRDRVITMDLGLHDLARNLHTNWPEFTLTYPEYDPKAKWEQALDRADTRPASRAAKAKKSAAAQDVWALVNGTCNSSDDEGSHVSNSSSDRSREKNKPEDPEGAVVVEESPPTPPQGTVTSGPGGVPYEPPRFDIPLPKSKSMQRSQMIRLEILGEVGPEQELQSPVSQGEFSTGSLSHRPTSSRPGSRADSKPPTPPVALEPRHSSGGSMKQDLVWKPGGIKSTRKSDAGSSISYPKSSRPRRGAVSPPKSPKSLNINTSTRRDSLASGWDSGDFQSVSPSMAGEPPPSQCHPHSPNRPRSYGSAGMGMGMGMEGFSPKASQPGGGFSFSPSASSSYMSGRPLIWFGDKDKRLFQTVQDIPLPVDTPTMKQIELMAAGIIREELQVDFSTISTILLPALVLRDWEETMALEAVLEVEMKEMEAREAEAEALQDAAMKEAEAARDAGGKEGLAMEGEMKEAGMKKAESKKEEKEKEADAVSLFRAPSASDLRETEAAACEGVEESVQGSSTETACMDENHEQASEPKPAVEGIEGNGRKSFAFLPQADADDSGSADAEGGTREAGEPFVGAESEAGDVAEGVAGDVAEAEAGDVAEAVASDVAEAEAGDVGKSTARDEISLAAHDPDRAGREEAAREQLVGAEAEEDAGVKDEHADGGSEEEQEEEGREDAYPLGDSDEESDADLESVPLGVRTVHNLSKSSVPALNISAAELGDLNIETSTGQLMKTKLSDMYRTSRSDDIVPGSINSKSSLAGALGAAAEEIGIRHAEGYDIGDDLDSKAVKEEEMKRADLAKQLEAAKILEQMMLSSACIAEEDSAGGDETSPTPTPTQASAPGTSKTKKGKKDKKVKKSKSKASLKSESSSGTETKHSAIVKLDSEPTPPGITLLGSTEPGPEAASKDTSSLRPSPFTTPPLGAAPIPEPEPLAGLSVGVPVEGRGAFKKSHTIKFRTEVEGEEAAVGGEKGEEHEAARPTIILREHTRLKYRDPALFDDEGYPIRPVFKPTLRQLNIYLGGGMTDRMKHNKALKNMIACDSDDEAPPKAKVVVVRAPEPNFYEMFDVNRVLMDANEGLLDSYNLIAELQTLHERADTPRLGTPSVLAAQASDASDPPPSVPSNLPAGMRNKPGADPHSLTPQQQHQPGFSPQVSGSFHTLPSFGDGLREQQEAAPSPMPQGEDSNSRLNPLQAQNQQDPPPLHSHHQSSAPRQPSLSPQHQPGQPPVPRSQQSARSSVPGIHPILQNLSANDYELQLREVEARLEQQKTQRALLMRELGALQKRRADITQQQRSDPEVQKLLEQLQAGESEIVQKLMQANQMLMQITEHEEELKKKHAQAIRREQEVQDLSGARSESMEGSRSGTTAGGMSEHGQDDSRSGETPRIDDTPWQHMPAMGEVSHLSDGGDTTGGTPRMHESPGLGTSPRPGSQEGGQTLGASPPGSTRDHAVLGPLGTIGSSPPGSSGDHALLGPPGTTGSSPPGSDYHEGSVQELPIASQPSSVESASRMDRLLAASSSLHSAPGMPTDAVGATSHYIGGDVSPWCQTPPEVPTSTAHEHEGSAMLPAAWGGGGLTAYSSLEGEQSMMSTMSMPGLLFGHQGADAGPHSGGRAAHRRHNLRNKPPPELPSSDPVPVAASLPVRPQSSGSESRPSSVGDNDASKAQVPTVLSTVLPSLPSAAPKESAGAEPPLLPPDMDALCQAELEALQSMWSSNLYSSADVAADADAEIAVQQLIAQAAEDEWKHYEESAAQMVDELANALLKRDVVAGIRGQGKEEARTASPDTVAGYGARSKTKQDPHHLRTALAIMEDQVAEDLDPDQLTGLAMRGYPTELADLMDRLVVAPMAAKYLFWKKVQSINLLRQQVMEDRALQDQLRQISWFATLDLKPIDGPSGHWVRERGAAGPQRASVPKPPGLKEGNARAPTSSFALASSGRHTQRAPFVHSSPVQYAGPATQLSKPMTLAQRQAASEAGSGSSSMAGSPTRGSPPLAPSPARAGRQPPAGPPGTHPGMDQMAAMDAGVSVVPGSREELALQLRAEVDERRWLQSLEGEQEWDDNHSSDEEIDIVNRLARMTVVVHRDQIKKRFQQPGQPPGNPGRGTALGTFGKEDNRYTFLHGASPFVTMPPPRSPKAAAHVSTQGASKLTATANTLPEAKALASGLQGTGATLILNTASKSPVPPEDLAAHLPKPRGQERPNRVPYGMLAPLPNPPAPTSALEQAGNVHFTTPKLTAYNNRLTSRENSFVSESTFKGSGAATTMPSPMPSTMPSTTRTRMADAKEGVPISQLQHSGDSRGSVKSQKATAKAEVDNLDWNMIEDEMADGGRPWSAPISEGSDIETF